MDKKISLYVTNLLKIYERIKLGAKLQTDLFSKTFDQQNNLYTNSSTEHDFVFDGLFDVNTTCSVPIMCRCVICNEKKLSSTMISVPAGEFGVICCRTCIS